MSKVSSGPMAARMFSRAEEEIEFEKSTSANLSTFLMARRGRTPVVGGFISGLGSGLRNSGLKDLLGSEGMAEMSSSSDWENRCSESDDCWLAKLCSDASVFWESWKITRWRRRGTKDSGSESTAASKRFAGSLRMGGI